MTAVEPTTLQISFFLTSSRLNMTRMSPDGHTERWSNFRDAWSSVCYIFFQMWTNVLAMMRGALDLDGFVWTRLGPMSARVNPNTSRRITPALKVCASVVVFFFICFPSEEFPVCFPQRNKNRLALSFISCMKVTCTLVTSTLTAYLTP